jgi:hypothetical protein
MKRVYVFLFSAVLGCLAVIEEGVYTLFPSWYNETSTTDPIKGEADVFSHEDRNE